MATISEEKIIEFLMEVKDRVEIVQSLKSQHENTHQVSYYNGQLEELNRIIEQSKVFFNVDAFEINVAQKTLDSYQLSLKDAAGESFQGAIKAFDVDHAKQKAKLEYPEYRVIEATRV
jgi:hypothetical protein